MKKFSATIITMLISIVSFAEMAGSTKLITTDSSDTETLGNPKAIKMNAKITSLLAF